MFLKTLKIEDGSTVVRDISFHKGINLIVDETKTSDKKESGNNVGKTTVLRLIDYCLGGKGDNIYKDSEFHQHTNSDIEDYLKQNNVLVTLILADDIENPSNEICIRRNFLSRQDKIMEINDKKFTNITDFGAQLKRLIFDSEEDKPTFRQIIAKNIRDEKNRLQHTIKVLHATTTKDVYEPLVLFWLGIELGTDTNKEKLNRERKVEERLQSRLRKDGTLSSIEQSLRVINRSINELTAQKESFAINHSFEQDLAVLNQVKSDINRYSTDLSRFEIRKELIIESKTELEKDVANVNTDAISRLYNEAKALIPNLQKTFEETVDFHNKMISERLKFITQELPALESYISTTKREINSLLSKEQLLASKLQKTGAAEDLQKIIAELNAEYEKKGKSENAKQMWEKSNEKIKNIDKKLKALNEDITSLDSIIQERISAFNQYFSSISYRMYGDREILSAEPTHDGYEFKITQVGGNHGTGKKKGQIAAFDLAYIQFADSEDIKCLHFVLNDQIENVHDNQIGNLLTEIVIETNCQYVLPVLRDKLPDGIDINQYTILTLSQFDKLFNV